MSSMTSNLHKDKPSLQLAIQTLLLPGDSLETKFANARRYGFDAVEVAVGPDFDLGKNIAEVQSAIANTGVPVVAICTHPIHDPMEGDATARHLRLQGLVDLLRLADEIGAHGVVSVPVRSRDLLAATTSLDDAINQMSDDLVDSIGTMAEQLPDGTASLFLEPLNRYEAWFLNRVEQAVNLSNRIGSPRVKALADLFHMNIEESNLGDPIRYAGGQLGHVHVADNNRVEPGAGYLDFRPFFRGLQDIGYTGAVSIECFSSRGPVVSGDPEVVLPASVRFMRSAWDDALSADDF